MSTNHIIRKSSRTISGVTPVAVMTGPIDCPGACVFCPTYNTAPKSYTPESPAVLRALATGYDPYKQVELRLKILSKMGHPCDKVELIIMGGTFPAAPVEYQYEFIKGCYDALNGSIAADLQEAKHINETAERRCIGVCIETRPDFCGDDEIMRMLDFGATRVEVGVQTLDDEIFRLVRRGHYVNDVIQATSRLKKYGLKVYYHWMPGLPGSSIQHDIEMAAQLFYDDNFKPDGIKLYPTLVIAGTELETWYRDGKYTPYTMDELTEIMISIKKLVPEYVRIPRLMRDIPKAFIIAGCQDLSLRSSVQKVMKTRGLNCKCTRCREYGHRLRDKWAIGEPQLHRYDYTASGGNEIFLTYQDEQDTLFGLLRLRINPGDSDCYRAIIREIHVFGQEVSIGEQNTQAAQHKGLGVRLIREAERIARSEFGACRIAVISGVGAREYFRTELGYQLDGSYMAKNI